MEWYLCISVGEIFTIIGQGFQLKHWTDFAIAGEGISVSKLYRNSPVRTCDVGSDTIHSIRGSPVEALVMAGYAIETIIKHRQVPKAIIHTARECKIIHD
uniref:Uncharacterized protein n=1 Tax=Panagrolaimus sp. PS1159 TaxID=55785 RepID=A0AC35GGX1_9BILA